MSRKILVVEDNEVNSELLCDWLELNGYECTAVADLGRAQHALHSQHIDAVLLDIQLGSEDGAELAHWIRRQPDLQNIPVIAVTAHALPSEQKRIIQAGCNAYVSKPIDFKSFGQMLEQWMARAADLQTTRSGGSERKS